MLIKINEAALNGASSSLKITLYTDNLSGSIDVSTLTPASAFTDMLILENLSDDPITSIPITSYAFTGDGSDGKLTLSFDAGTNTVSAGDILALRQGINIKISPLSRIQNTASISISATASTITTTTPEAIITPLTTSTADKNYSLFINIATADGVTLNTTEYAIATPFTVNGTPVYSVTLALDGTPPFNTKTEIAYTVTYKNELGENLQLKVGDVTTIAAYLMPQ
ncbi:MAG: hypothetical protein ACRC6T_03590 [Sarcina sp.]